MIVPVAPRAAYLRDVEAMDLIFYDPDCLPRVRRVPSWKILLADLDHKPRDVEEIDLRAAAEPGAVEDRREIMEVFTRGAPSDAALLEETAGRAVREDGRFLPPLALIAGELITPFDEVEAVKVTVTTVTPLVGNDEALRATVDGARDFLKLPALLSAPAVAEGLTTRVREAWSLGKRAVPQGYLDAQTERALLEQRAYQKRRVLGKTCLRALLQVGSSVVTTYLPEQLAPQLPMFPRFKVRVIARVQLSLDPYESGPLCLDVVALARVVSPARRGSA
jgi:hypothetical protein